MKIIVGLGNPGREYAATRHNAGFMVVNRIAKLAGAEGVKKRFRSELVEGVWHGEKIVLVAPQTYMNLSGIAVREVVNWYKAPLEDLLIVTDELDLAFGVLRLRARGSAGGHNGLASIIEQLGTQEFSRLRVGIGRGPGNSVNRVLGRFSADEETELAGVIARAAEAVELWLRFGALAAMNEINRREKPAAVAAGEGATR